MSKWFKAVAAALVLIATPAAAQTTPSLEGSWVYRTAVWTPAQCVISGTATVTRTGDGVYSAHISSTEACATGSITPSVAQTCTIQQRQDDILVTCAVDSEEMRTMGYLPDDFVLRAQTPDRLLGLLTANWNAPAEWRRTTAPVS